MKTPYLYSSVECSDVTSLDFKIYYMNNALKKIGISAFFIINTLVLTSACGRLGCCKICSKGKACGDSCISRDYECHQPPGCACDK